MSDPASNQPILTARGVHRTFSIGRKRLEVLRGVDLDVSRQELLFIVGKSGAGKTTLLYTLAGLEPPEKGEVLLDGRPLYGNGERAIATLRNQRFGFVFQNYFLLPELTALENTMLPSMIAGKGAEEKARGALERVRLGERAQHLPSELSGGEQQRVAIARALVNDPAILFADEPTGNLDSNTGRVVFDLLLAFARDEKKTLVVVTHDPKLAGGGDRRVEIRDGVIAG